ncbi:MAG: hypothetical protein CO143_00635 [Candidatus Moranbacteria bacterium CG_4_9_14_3_um_filter_45_14]|nr:MAG: hypothetical protein AUK19_01840 [Candidatus Moranbacteria bacterium CG2_30_45_14]PJA85877.1 MAG: hypothetical protein CO143_00635 [Candidatus Moranbacteria bacterium CG_4_9_14_3_um_filter_45_14]
MKIGKHIIFLSLIAFVLHSVWENAQAPLFRGYVSFTEHFSACFVGTIGDVIITLSVYFIFALFKNDLGWLSALNKKDIILLAIVGFLIAVGIEQRAMLQGRWAYADVMPIIPYLKVGFMPILQMTLLLPFSIYLTKKLKKYE